MTYITQVLQTNDITVADKPSIFSFKLAHCLSLQSDPSFIPGLAHPLSGPPTHYFPLTLTHTLAGYL